MSRHPEYVASCIASDHEFESIFNEYFASSLSSPIFLIHLGWYGRPADSTIFGERPAVKVKSRTSFQWLPPHFLFCFKIVKMFQPAAY